jgi:glyoxylase I family protein
MTPPPLTQLHHVALQVTSLPTARAFYEGVLGCRVTREQPHALWCALGDTILMLEATASRPDATAGWARPDAGPFVVAFRIAPKDRASWAAHLAAHGVKVERASPFSLYFRDPFGARLAVSHHPEVAPDAG